MFESFRGIADLEGGNFPSSFSKQIFKNFQKMIFSEPCFWAENGGGFVWWNFGYLCFWVENGGGGLKNDKKRQKSAKNDRVLKKKALKNGKMTCF